MQPVAHKGLDYEISIRIRHKILFVAIQCDNILSSKSGNKSITQYRQDRSSVKRIADDITIYAVRNLVWGKGIKRIEV